MDTPLKQCSRKEKCVNPLGSWLPATTEYFDKNKQVKSGLNSWCLACKRAYQREYNKRPENQPRIRENSRRFGQTQKRKEYSAQWRRENRKKDPERYKEYDQRYYESEGYRERRQTPEYRQQKRDVSKRYAQKPENQEKIAERQRRLKQSPEFKQRRRIQRADPEHRSKEAAYQRSPRGKAVRQASKARRRARERSLQNTFTVADWERALAYFNFCCAYCGKQRDLWSILHADHFIPLADPTTEGTTPNNIVPACATCNTSKHAHPPHEWLADRFGKRRAKKIIEQIATYFEWVKQQGGT